MLFVLGTNCGLRISDLLSLNVGDVRNKTHIQIVEKKTGKFKKFPINNRLKPMLEDFVKGRRNAEPLFLSHWRHRLDRVTAYYLIRDACEKAGLQEKIGTHSMRKTFGYHHYKQFKDVVILQKYSITQARKLLCDTSVLNKTKLTTVTPTLLYSAKPSLLE